MNVNKDLAIYISFCVLCLFASIGFLCTCIKCYDKLISYSFKTRSESIEVVTRDGSVSRAIPVAILVEHC